MSDTLDATVDQGQVEAAVAGLRGEAVDLLLDLVHHPSLLGQERSAQDRTSR